MKINLNGLSVTPATLDHDTKTAFNRGSAAGSNISQDRTTFRSAGNSVQSMVGQALSAPEVRQGKVEALRSAINSGEYKLDPSKIADAIISEGGQ